MPVFRRLSRLPVAARYAVPAVLVAVALTQLALVKGERLNPWVGGGFGMFAEVDRREHRALRAYATVAGRQTPLDVHEFGEASGANLRLVRRTTALPTEGALRAMAGALIDDEWTAQGLPWSRGMASGEPPIALEAIRIEVRRLDYASDGTQARPELVGQIRVAS